MNYRCTLDTPDGSISWNGSVRIISHAPVFMEAEISGKGSSFHVITGSSSNGFFLCVPNWRIGCELSHLDDVFWNTERLSPFLNPVDLTTLTQGLSILPDVEKLLASCHTSGTAPGTSQLRKEA